MEKSKLKKLLAQVKLVKAAKVEKHQNADRLYIVQINAGKSSVKDLEDEEGLIQIVTAADNVKEGDYVFWLGPGTQVPGWVIKGEELKLESRPMRGEISHGMILAEDEIGLSDDHEVIYIVEDKNGDLENKIGDSILEVMGEEVMDRILSEGEDVLKDLKKVTLEILGEGDLKRLLKDNQKLNHYIGFEISGLVHLGQGLMSGIVIRELQKLGIHPRIFLADWHTWINNKLGGDRDFIKQVAEEYFTPAMKIAIDIAGGNSDEVEFILGSDLYHNNDIYWQSVIDVSKNLTLSRVLKSTTILGREASNSMEFAMLIYPSMQTADIFEMQNHIVHAGTDQRNVHVIAREVAGKLSIRKLVTENSEAIKPIAIHHELVPGLQKPAQWPLPENLDKVAMLTSLKMSKSIPDSAIFIQDSEDDIRRKINKAFCPEKEIGYNPVLSWVRMLIFPIKGMLEIERKDEHGGNLVFEDYELLEQAYEKGDIHPLDLKNAVANALVEMLTPARELFEQEEKKAIIDEIIKSRVTR